MTEQQGAKRCFVIGRIGNEESETRRKSDWLLQTIIKPVLEQEPFNLKVMRADEDPRPGMIDSQVINAVSDADLVVADLSEHNANVFYELAIRHMEEKPVIHMIRKDERIPFDVHPYRTIEYRLDWPNDIEKAKEALRQQATDAMSVDHEVDNPVIKARGQKALRETAHGEIKAILDLITDEHSKTNRALTSIMERLDQLESLPEVQRYRRALNLAIGERLVGRTLLTAALPAANPFELAHPEDTASKALNPFALARGSPSSDAKATASKNIDTTPEGASPAQEP